MTLLLSMDVEASGPAPLHGDMISFAAVVIEDGLSRSFDSGLMRPECEHYWPEAYAAIGVSREQHLAAPHSIRDRIFAFADWLEGLNDRSRRYIMVSDNPGFDFMWMNFELLNHIGQQLLGHSARRIGDVWSGLRKRPLETGAWRRYRVTPHDHNALNDAMGNAEAWLEMWRQYG
jgi:hypothetical protein